MNLCLSDIATAINRAENSQRRLLGLVEQVDRIASGETGLPKEDRLSAIRNLIGHELRDLCFR